MASSTILSVTPAGFESFSKMADSIAVQVTDEKHRGKLVSCKPKNPKAPDDACAADFLNQYGLMLFRRPLAANELKAIRTPGEAGIARISTTFQVF